MNNQEKLIVFLAYKPTNSGLCDKIYRTKTKLRKLGGAIDWNLVCFDLMCQSDQEWLLKAAVLRASCIAFNALQ